MATLGNFRGQISRGASKNRIATHLGFKGDLACGVPDLSRYKPGPVGGRNRQTIKPGQIDLRQSRTNMNGPNQQRSRKGIFQNFQHIKFPFQSSNMHDKAMTCGFSRPRTGFRSRKTRSRSNLPVFKPSFIRRLFCQLYQSRLSPAFCCFFY